MSLYRDETMDRVFYNLYSNKPDRQTEIIQRKCEEDQMRHECQMLEPRSCVVPAWVKGSTIKHTITEVGAWQFTDFHKSATNRISTAIGRMEGWMDR